MSKVNHPKHYNAHPSGIECIDVVEHFNFNRGNAIKYIWRAGEKENEVEDLEKAIWYLTREVRRITPTLIPMNDRDCRVSSCGLGGNGFCEDCLEWQKLNQI